MPCSWLDLQFHDKVLLASMYIFVRKRSRPVCLSVFWSVLFFWYVLLVALLLANRNYDDDVVWFNEEVLSCRCVLKTINKSKVVLICHCFPLGLRNCGGYTKVKQQEMHLHFCIQTSKILSIQSRRSFPRFQLSCPWKELENTISAIGEVRSDKPCTCFHLLYCSLDPVAASVATLGQGSWHACWWVFMLGCRCSPCMVDSWSFSLWWKAWMILPTNLFLCWSMNLRFVSGFSISLVLCRDNGREHWRECCCTEGKRLGHE